MATAQLASGSLFASRFAIERAAGSGGMGTVYRACDRYSGKIVALKLLHPGGVGADEGERFAREAQLLSEVRHPGIVSYVAHGQTADGQRFLAMEWLEGEDLGQRLLRGPLPLRECVLLLERVADALVAAHQRQIIHRDLKPTNLFLVGGQVEQVKLLDFGIARRMNGMQAMTRTGVVIGTPEYMAPEQARGSSQLTPAADLFSLGCVLYECLTGRPPFIADHIAAVLVRILFEEPSPVGEQRLGTPAALAALVHRLLAKNPQERVADAATLRIELSGLGDLKEAALAETIVDLPPKIEKPGEQEQGLFSIVLAAPLEEEIGLGATLPGSMLLKEADREALLNLITALGVVPDFLANGTLVVTVPPTGSAYDQAARAARAALVVKERWSAAVVSMATGRGILRGRTTVGEVVELAARSLKESGQNPPSVPAAGVLLDTLSARLLEGRFAQTPRPGGALLLYEDRDADASRPLLGKPTPCVGRETELATLETQLDGCIEESLAQAVLVTASPGVGKSRLRHEFLRRVEKRSDQVLVLIGRGDMISAGSPYGILAAALRRLCGFTAGEPADSQARRLQERIARHISAPERERVVAFIGELCNLAFPEEGIPLLQAARRDPRIMSDQINLAFIDFLRAECAVQPLLLVLEDLHWGDAMTIRLVEMMLLELAAQPLLVLALARPELTQQFPNLWAKHVQQISLRPLSKKACERLVQQVLGKQLAKELVLGIIDRSAGNALYLEELIRAAADGSPQELPETVLAMLQARVGHLSPDARRLLRAASVFGESFWLGGVCALVDMSRLGADPKDILTELVRDEVLELRRESRFAAEPEYHFRHALMREAVYSLLTQEDRTASHRLAARFLLALGENDPRILAEHAELGGDGAQALLHYVAAAQLAHQRNHLEQILLLVERGLSCGAEHQLRGELLGLRCLSQFYLGDMLGAVVSAEAAIGLLRPGSRRWCEANAIFISASAMTKRLDLMIQGVQLASTTEPEAEAIAEFSKMMYGLLAMLALSGARDLATAQLLRLTSYVEPLPPTERQAWAHFRASCGYVTWALGDDPWGHLQTAQTACAALDEFGERYVLSSVEVLLGLALSELGDIEQAKQRLRKAHQVAEKLNFRMNMYISALELALVLSQSESLPGQPNQADQAEAEKLVLAARSTLDTQDDVLTGLAALAMAASLEAKGELEEAATYARQSAEKFIAMPIYRLRAMTRLTSILIRKNQLDSARAAAEEALQLLQFVSPVGGVEVAARFTAAAALHAAGEREAAQVALLGALQQLRCRADKIPEPAARRRYLCNVPHNAQVLRLARQWLGEQSVAGLDSDPA